jgi:hypothetical protein
MQLACDRPGDPALAHGEEGLEATLPAPILDEGSDP